MASISDPIYDAWIELSSIYTGGVWTEPQTKVRGVSYRLASLAKQLPQEPIEKVEEKITMPASTPLTTTKDIAASLVDQLKAGKQLHDDFAREFNENYHISGKLIPEWQDHFRLKIPPDLDPRTCQDFDTKLLELHQEASFMKAACDCRLQAYREANGQQYRVAYAELVAEYKSKGHKLPAKDTLSVLADEKVGSIREGIIHAEIELSFWKEIINDLYNARKLIENATLNLSVEAKALQSQNYLDALGHKVKGM